MSMPKANQCIHCDVPTCEHHAQDGLCQLDNIRVAPRCGCHSGDCEESMCASYQGK